MGLLYVALIANLWASDPVSTAIEQAQAAAVRKNRLEAVTILNKAIAAAAPPLRGRVKLIETENAIAKIFFTDKGQRLFEAGQSSMYDSPDTAMNQYREALNLEDNNILVLINIARLQMIKQDCAGAQVTLAKARSLYAYAPDAALLELRTVICQKNFEVFREKLKSLPALEKGQEMYLQYFNAQDLLQQKMWRRASEILQKVSDEDPKFPEPYIYLAKAGEELGRDVEAFQTKYVSLCKNVSLRDRKRYAMEPLLCAQAKEVENALSQKVDL